MIDKILAFLTVNNKKRFHSMQIARGVNAKVATILPYLMALRRQRRIKSYGACCCANMRYWSV